MLSSELVRKCKKLDAKDKEFLKFNRPAKLLIIAAVVVAFALLFYVPEDQKFADYPLESYSVGIFFTSAIVIAAFLLQKAKRYKVTGYTKNSVLVYRAYSQLEQYLEDGVFSHLENAEKSMDSLLSDLQAEWGELSKENPSLKSLVKPLDGFMKGLDNRVIPAIINEDEKDIKKILNTLSLLIDFFLSDDFTKIHEINKEFENYTDVSEEEESTIEKIKQHRHVVTIFLVLIVIGGGWLLSQSAKFVVLEISVETQLTLWATISVPFTVWVLHARSRK